MKSDDGDECLEKASLYAWGANNYGQLGLGFTCEQVLEPTLVENLPDNLNPIKLGHNDKLDSRFHHIPNGKSKGGMFGGGGHSLLLTIDGKLYGAGKNDFGQVGNGTQTKMVLNFEAIRGLEGQYVLSVACGWNHNIVLTVDDSSSKVGGKVWVWGSNSHSQLGLPSNEVPFSCLPICLDISDVVSISAGLRHTVIVTRKGKVYSWGHGLRGQLGHTDEEGRMITKQVTPKIISSIQDIPVKSVVCSQNTTYALTSSGYIMAWGDNKWGQLAHSPKNVSFFPYPLTIPSNYFDGSKVTEIFAGWSHCMAKVKRTRKEHPQYFGWGRSDYGQLAYVSLGGNNLDSEQYIVPGSPVQTDIPSSNEHCQTMANGKVAFNKRSDVDEKNRKKHDTYYIIKYRYIPRQIDEGTLRYVEEISCGSEHTIFRCGEHKDKIFACGWNEHGTCGNGSTYNVYEPFQIPLEGHAHKIGAGVGQSFAVMCPCPVTEKHLNPSYEASSSHCLCCPKIY